MKRKMSLLGAAIAVICASCAVAAEPTLAVKNVASGQRWPWNGKVDISCDLTGTGIVDLSLSATTNGVRVCDVVTLAGETTIDLNAAGGETNGVRFVWNAANDFAAVGLSGFHAENVKIEVVAERRPDPPSSGQLWKNGPVWAECNVGATTPEEPGYYFWWGDTVGYTNTGSGWISVANPSASIVFASYNATAKQTYDKDNGWLKTNGWIGESGNLVSTRDAATAHLDAPWRMPTSDEIEELVTNCVWTAKKMDSTLVGYVLTGKAPEYAGNSIFLPVTGSGSGMTTSSCQYGYFWSSTPDAETTTCSWYLRIGSSEHKRDSTMRLNGLPVRAVQDPPPGTLPMTVMGSSAETTIDLRTRVALPTGSVKPAGVAYSDTAWGAVASAPVTIGWKIEGTVHKGEFASGLTGSGTTAGALPKKNGDYKLTHSTGLLTSFVTFAVSSYPLGCEEDPWKVGEEQSDAVTAFTNGAGVVCFRPMRGVVSDDGLETIAVALGGADFPARLIAADGSETNDLQMLIGSGGGSYGNVAAALAGNDASYTLFETPGVPYLDWDDEKKEMTNALCGIGNFTVLRSWMSDIDAGKTYVVMDDVTNRSSRITTGCGSTESPTRIILCDGASLTAEYGVRVMEDRALVICGQEKGTGKLTAIGDGLGDERGDFGCYSGIGGGWSGGHEENCGTVTINGGMIVAVGGEHAAGIGGGDGGYGGTLTINGVFVIQASADGTETNLVAQAAYAADHGARSVSLCPGVGLKVPSTTTGYSYVVTNTTAAVEVPASPKDGTNVYAFVANDGYEVTYTLDNGYEWTTAPKANPLTGTITADTALAEVKVKARTYTVHYDGGWGSNGSMADDTFTMFVPTNLTANAFTIVGYDFTGWSKDGTTVAYTNRQEGVDFAKPGETLVLTALWTHVGVEPTDYNDLAAKLQQVTRPVTFDLVRDIEIPVGGKIEVPAGKKVTFNGIGKFDVTAERPALFCGYPVGTGLKPEDLDRFVTDKDVKAYFEDGKVVVRGRGETEEFPWLLGTAGHEGEVTAWAGDEMVLTKPTRGTASVAAFQSVTNALNGYVPGLGELKVISADGTATNNVVMLLGSDGVPYDTLADVLAADPMPETVRLFEVKGTSVEFNAMGGVHTNGSEIVTNFCVVTYELPEVPTRTNYTFLGWYDGWTNGAAVVSNGWDLLRYEPHTLYAKWWANKTSKEGEGSEVIGSEVVPGAETATITGAVASVGTDFVIPDRVSNGADGAAVVEIAPSSFKKGVYTKSKIESVTTPLFMTNIGQEAFMSVRSLKSLTVTEPKDYKDPTKKAKVKIGRKAFADTLLTELWIPEWVTDIDDYAFLNCEELKDVYVCHAVNLGTQVFRRAGVNNSLGGQVTVHMPPKLESDTAFMTSLSNSLANVKVVTDNSLVATFQAKGLLLENSKLTSGLSMVTLRLGMSRVTPWGELTPDAVTIGYRRSLSDPEEIKRPLSVTVDSNGDVKAVVAVPAGASSGFFRVINK